MKKLLLPLVVVGLLVFGPSLTASAGGLVAPTVTAIEPSAAYNDIDTRITIAGEGFAAETSGGVVTAAPLVSLGTRPLTDVTWVDTQTLTATVPWGMLPGVYALTVTNPGNEATTLPAAFEVKSGINSWNAGELNGAAVRQLLMKVDDPNTLYALAYSVGLFRSDDAGASWHFTSANVIGNADFVLDPHHPDWLYSASFDGLRVSKDKGETWPTLLFDTSGDAGYNEGNPMSSQVFVSPNTADTLFFAIYGDGVHPDYLGLKKSTNAGANWTDIAQMHGTAVQNVAFDPTPGSHDMALATSDARVFRSIDDGVTWTQVPSPPGIASLGSKGYLMYNPYHAAKPGELWLVSTEDVGGDYKCRITDPVPSWTRAEPSYYNSGYLPTFVGPNDVYIWEQHSTDGGATWEQFGPTPTWGGGDFVFNPDDTHTVYFTNATVGVQKSTTGGLPGPSGEPSWTVSNNGLSGMRCVSMSVSATDPLRVYATFDGWGGVYISDDGTSHWRYVPIKDSGQMWQVLQDPFDKGLLYATGGGFYTSRTEGSTWDDLGWNGVPDSALGLMGYGSLAADPFQEGHLLVSSRVGQSSTHDHDLGYLFSSDDHGATWTSVPVAGAAGSIGPIGDVEFDPSVDGTVYLVSDGNGVFKSVDHGATWARIDDPGQNMLGASNITIATQPTHELAVLAGGLFRSPADGAPRWQRVGDLFFNGGIAVHGFYFVDHDSARMYAATWAGLYFSGDMGVTWTRSAGALGGVQVTTLADASIDGHTLLYAATTGGDAGPVWNPASTAAPTGSFTALAAPKNSLVGAGIYRRAQVESTATFTSTGSRDGWILESSHTSNHGHSLSSGSSTLRLGDDASKKQYRSVLSFTTSGLPDDAVITGVTLRVRRQGVAGGGNPVTMFRGFMADIKKGHFGTSTGLQASDFQASASKSSYGPWTPSLLSNWYSIDLTGASAYVNKLSSNSGTTQIRLRFKLDDNGNRKANYLSLYSGNASASLRPQLVVTYYTP
jgi:hypothetical protein